jgi:hypothetical protein
VIPLDFPFTIDTLPYILFAALLAIVLVIVYIYRIKPVVQFPLSNEEDLGYGRIHLDKLGKFNEGRLTTAQNHFIENFSMAITAGSPDEQGALLEFRKAIFDNRWTLAQRVGREKFIYLFDANPLDKKYCKREDKGTETPIRRIGPVLDCGSVGTYHGFQYVFVKLDPEIADFTDEQREVAATLSYGLMYIEDAASNLTKLKFMADRVGVLEYQLEEAHGIIASKSAQLDTARLASGLESLTEPKSQKVGFQFGPKAKAWFGDWKQIAFAFVGYLVIAPLVISHFAPDTTPPMTTYLTAGIVVVCFFALPALRTIAGLFGRWRS